MSKRPETPPLAERHAAAPRTDPEVAGEVPGGTRAASAASARRRPVKARETIRGITRTVSLQRKPLQAHGGPAVRGGARLTTLLASRSVARAWFRGGRSVSSDADVPMPPLELVLRVGTPPSQDPFQVFEMVGLAERAHLLRLLPSAWSFTGKRVLDFGCGSGRTLRHLLSEARHAEIWGCDIDRASVDWLQAHLAPPLRVVENEADPPLPFPDASFDLVFALSVFSHLTDTWSAWLVELHRVLVDGGLLVATFHGRGTWPLGLAGQVGVAFDEDRIGMHIEHYGEGFETSWGPAVYLSEWWMRDHWGRAYDVVCFEPEGFPTQDPAYPNQAGQAVAVLRKRPAAVIAADLERPSDDPRELTAALASRELVYRELASKMRDLRREVRRLTEDWHAHQREIERLNRALAERSTSA